MTPEAKTRESIDRALARCGRIVQRNENIDPSASCGVALTEVALKARTTVVDKTPVLLLAAKEKERRSLAGHPKTFTISPVQYPAVEMTQLSIAFTADLIATGSDIKTAFFRSSIWQSAWSGFYFDQILGSVQIINSPQNSRRCVR